MSPPRPRPVPVTVRSPVAAHPDPPGLEALAGWAVTALVATLSLEWVTLGAVGAGFLKPFHLAAGVVGLVALIRWRPGDLVGPVMAGHGSVYWSYAVMLAMAAASSLAHASSYQSPTAIARQAAYALASLAVAGVTARALDHPPFRRVVAMSGLATVVVVGSGLLLGLATQGTNPLPVVADAVIHGDPDIITNQVFRSAFRSNEDLAEVGSNLRHKVFVAVALGTFTGLAFAPGLSPGRRRLVRAAGVAGGVLVVASLSRSAMVILAIPLVLGPLGVLVRGRARPRTAALAVVVMAGLALAVASPVADLVATRFSSSGSYESRLEALSSGFVATSVDAAVIGLAKSPEVRSPHNLVLNAWLSGGVVAAGAAVVLVVALARRWLRLLRDHLRDAQPGMDGIGRVWVLGLGAIPLVRAFTAGNQYHLVEWTAIALFLVLSRAVAARNPAPTAGGEA